MGFSLLGVSIPNFWLGPMLMLLFSVTLGWLPVSGMDAPGSIVLPAITLGTALAAILSRMARSSWLEAMSMDAMRTARASGVTENMIWWRHAARLAAVPVVTMFAMLEPETMPVAPLLTTAALAAPPLYRPNTESARLVKNLPGPALSNKAPKSTNR